MTKLKWWQEQEGMTHTYVGNVCALRKNTDCRLLKTWRGLHTPRNVLIEFADGYRIIAPSRTLRIRKEIKNGAT